MTDTIDGLAVAVATARQHQERAKAVLEQAEAYSGNVSERIAAKHAEKGEIAKRRAAGKGEDDFDAGRLTLIASDLDALNELLAAAERDVKAAQANVEAAGAQVAEAERRLGVERDRVLLEKLADHSEKLAVLLGQTVQEAKELAARHGWREVWRPSHTFQQEMRRLEHSTYIVRAA